MDAPAASSLRPLLTAFSGRLAMGALMAAAILLSACKPTAKSATPVRPAARATSLSRSATLSELESDVQTRPTAGSIWQKARVGQEIKTGASVKTGADSRARIDISDGSIIRLGPTTVFELAEISPSPRDPVTRMKLSAGRLWATVTKALGTGAFEIDTPTGLAAVRGSMMGVAYDPATTSLLITCLEGECQLAGTSGTSVTLQAGQQSTIPGIGQDPGIPGPIDAAELGQWLGEVPEALPALATQLPSPADTPQAPTPTSPPAAEPAAVATPTEASSAAASPTAAPATAEDEAALRATAEMGKTVATAICGYLRSLSTPCP